jgi:hypothetical protein
MASLLVATTATALVLWIGLHGALLVLLARAKPRWRALVALIVPPLAPYWAWSDGARRPVYAWAGALAGYTLGLTLLLR